MLNMMPSNDKQEFKDYMKETKDPVAAAILILGSRVRNLSDNLCGVLNDFDHQICLGIRNGLDEFGSSIYSAISELKK